ncbi:hypothetical protein PHMEG_00028848 [Phytophthora megakarya]|uniref:Uncharacterized protein n=1 Tax=Phytophthora megakarya TaxID=4795 RepID=A0A225V5L7_9STRA|nr:hypothetical protein PHMEG_00028848 [Phytophthora megakarya]
MQTSQVFAYFKLSSLETDGYTYGSAEMPSSSDEPVLVEMVASGRWAFLDGHECTRAAVEVRQRAVTKEEALSGIGTYVGSYVCVAKAEQGSPKRWDYGVVTGYTWFPDRRAGELFVCFGEESSTWVFNSLELQDLTIPSYALRPCYNVPVADLMPAEMRQRHSDAFDHFSGSGLRATRNSATILRRLSAPELDESHTIPLYEAAAARVVFVSIKYALDFSYHQDGRRRVPPSVNLGESIFTGPVTADLGTATSGTRQIDPVMEGQSFLPGQLSDSDDSDGEAICVQAPTSVQHDSYAFLPNPAILRAIYSWDFGLRGLSVMHFAPIVVGSKRASSLNMTDFSKSASLPTAVVPKDLGSVIDSIDGLAVLVAVVFMPYVSDLVAETRKFVASLKSREGFSSVGALSKLVYWINWFQASHVLSHQAAGASSSGTSRVPKGKPGAQARAPVPQDVQDALPMMNGQSLCMRYISKVPCPSKHDGCFSRKRGHFAPATLPGIVFDFIQKNYGGLRKDCAAISREQSDD